MTDESIYHDIAVLIGDQTDDAWDAMSDSYEFVSRMLIAVLQKRGRVRLPTDWLELTDGFVVAAHPLRDGTYQLEAVRRGEVPTDSREGAARLRGVRGHDDRLWSPYWRSHFSPARSGPLPAAAAVSTNAAERVVSVDIANDLEQQNEKLLDAIRSHRDAIEDAGPLALERTMTHNQLVVMHAKQAADERLWANV